LGVSVTGWMNNPDILLDSEIQIEGANIVKQVNKEVAELLNINAAARTTCVKPSGNASVLLETASGIHAEHSPRYLRHVQMNKEAEVANLIAETNPYMVEESVWSTNRTDYCIAFPVISPKGSLYKEDLFGVDLLEKVQLVQQNWVEAGTNEHLCADSTLRHNVSNTVTVPEHMWGQVEGYLFANKNYFAGVSFLSGSGDKDFNQAPMTEVLTEEQIVAKHGRASMFAAGLIVDTRKGFTDLWEATSIAQMPPEFQGELSDLRAEWIRRFNKFADNYFGGDMKDAEYCLKDVFLLHKWTKIQQNIQPIDFVNQLTDKTFTDIDTMGAVACQGGACEITF
jgi:ribonucleoside-diphosphate reductase alpha chain